MESEKLAFEADMFSDPCLQADTFEDLREQVRNAVRCHFDEGQGPAVIRLHYVRDEVLAG